MFLMLCANKFPVNANEWYCDNGNDQESHASGINNSCGMTGG